MTFLKVVSLFNNVRTTTNTAYTSIADREPIWHYLSADYDGVNSIKFAASFRAASGDTAAMIVSDVANNNITASEITTTSTTNVNVISADFSADLTNNTDYRARFKRAAGSGTESFDTANILISQTDPTATVTVIELGEDNNVPSTSYSAPADFAIFKYDASMYDGTVAAYLEGDLHCNASGNTTYCALYDLTAAAQVSSSEVSHTGNTTTTLKTSSAITLVDGHEYRLDIKGTSTSDDIPSGKIIIKQTGVITKTACYIPILNTTSSGTETSYTAQNRLFTFNASDFSATTKNFYYEATLKVSANSGNAQLYNDTDAAEIGAVSTSSTSYERVRSSALTMPTDDSNIFNNYRKIITSGTVTHARSFLIAELWSPKEVSVSDSITVSESVGVSVQAPSGATTLNVSVSDSVTVSESVTVAVQPTTTRTVSVSENVTLSEAVTVVRGTAQVTVSDTITVSDTPLISSPTAAVVVSDTVTVSESVGVSIQVATPRTVSVADTVTLTESVLATTNLTGIEVSDTITVTEEVSLSLVSGSPDIPTSASDTVTLTESVSLSVGTPAVSVTETITITESVSGYFISEITVEELVQVDDLLTDANLGLNVMVSEYVSISESVERSSHIDRYLPGIHTIEKGLIGFRLDTDAPKFTTERK